MDLYPDPKGVGAATPGIEWYRCMNHLKLMAKEGRIAGTCQQDLPVAAVGNGGRLGSCFVARAPWQSILA